MENKLDIQVPQVVFMKLSKFPVDTKKAVEHLINILNDDLNPFFLHLREFFYKCKSSKTEDLDDSFVLYLRLLSKYMKLMNEVFQMEMESQIILQENRNWVVGRIEWALKLLCNLDMKQDNKFKSGDEFILWIDKALEILENIIDNFQNDEEKENLRYKQSLWKIQCTSTYYNLHLYTKDMVSAAMEICQNCLPTDQNVIVARCHVVFRELKKFLTELTSIEDIHIDDFVIKVEDIKYKENLHYPTIRLLGSVLKDSIYNLEASINRALLGLVLHCMADPVQPMMNILQLSGVDSINREDTLECLLDEFDTHTDRITQIGMFSISSSADKKRILLLRNCLINLEEFQTQLIPSLMMDSTSYHSKMLIKEWRKEINSLKLLVFLIIDPTALMDLVIEMFRSGLNKMKSQTRDAIDLKEVKCLIGLGICVFDYVQIYNRHEPNSIPHIEKVYSHVSNLQKAIKECTAISQKFLNHQSKPSETGEMRDSLGNVKPEDWERIMKRFKLLYSVLLNISEVVIQESFSSTDDNLENVNKKNDETYVHKGVIGVLDKFKNNVMNETKVLCRNPSPSLCRSTIVRTQSSQKTYTMFTKKYPLISSKFADGPEQSDIINSASFFSSGDKQSEFLLANISSKDCPMIGEPKKMNNECTFFKSFTEKSNFGTNQGRSLRKTLLKNQVKFNIASFPDNINIDLSNNTEDLLKIENCTSNSGDANSTDWHFTAILEQLTCLSNTISVMNNDIDKKLNDMQEKSENIQPLKLKVNDVTFGSPKEIWNIEIKNDETIDNQLIIENNHTTNKLDFKSGNEQAGASVTIENPSAINCGIDMSFGSDVPTPERLKDINLLEEKLANLRSFWK